MTDHDNVSHYVSIAQLVEQWCEVPQVIGSIPIRNVDCRKTIKNITETVCNRLSENNNGSVNDWEAKGSYPLCSGSNPGHAIIVGGVESYRKVRGNGSWDFPS